MNRRVAFLFTFATALAAGACVPTGGDAADGAADDAKPRPNRLIDEKSIYLQQHAHNPVDWYPWGDAAFDAARAQDKPVFLSIGYSTCHWCHVMERESFEDADIARFLNEHFIAIKVDREERPDVDATYMSYVTALTGRGGWPMTVFLTPQRVPFFGGTYYPPRRALGLPGFLEVIEGIEQEWRENRERLLAAGDAVVKLLQSRADIALGAADLDGDLLSLASREFASRFDAEHGGDRGAPKFPPPMILALLLRHEARGGEQAALDMVVKTLHAMADGGIHDQLGGGFARYSVDERWLVPHFEKMLYTQALLARVYTEAWQRTRDKRFEAVARATLDYVLRDMRVAGGAFAAAEDADSEGEEGRFYTWTPAELEAVLGVELGAFAARAFGVTAAGHLDGRSVLHRAMQDGLDAAQQAQLEDARAQLFAARALRVRPLRDDKVLTSWNALMISALAFCGRVFDEPRYVQAAREAAAFVRDHLIDADGRVLRRFRDGEALGPGYLDDYAFLGQALLDLYEADFGVEWFDLARRVTDLAAERFGDEPTGTFFDTAHDAEELLVRPRDAADGALPSASGVLAKNLIRLSDFLHDDARRARALRCVHAFGKALTRAPTAYAELLHAHAWSQEAPREIVFAGTLGAPDLDALVRAFYREFVPFRVLAHAPPDQAARAELERRMPIVEGRVPHQGKAAAYWCEDHTCRLPVTDAAALFAVPAPPRGDAPGAR